MAHDEAPTCVIKVLRGAARGGRVEWPADVTRPLTVGREPDNALVLPDEHVSSQHVELLFDGEHIRIVDKGSTNGTRIQRAGRKSVLHPDVAQQARSGDFVLVGDPDEPVVLQVFSSLDDESEHEQSRVVATTHIGRVDAYEGKVSQDPNLLRQLYVCTKRLHTSLETSEVLQTGADVLFELLPKATHVTIMLQSETDDDDAGRFIPVLGVRRDAVLEAPKRPSRWLRAKIKEERSAVLVTDAADQLDSSRSLQKAEIDSMIAAPLFVGDRITGILQIDRRASAAELGQAGVFNQDELEFVVVLANQIALTLENARLVSRLRVAEKRLQGENTYFKGRDAEPTFEMIGESKPMQEVFSLIEKVQKTLVPVCIEGETGTGKELVARLIHYRSTRHDKLFVAQNCSALPDSLLESELFGHVKGAFTGATSDKKGLFELADGGTIFLDEIGETTPAMQSKLLRVLQEGEVRRVGDAMPITVDARVISATNRNLEEEVAEGRFREDLYYRLKVFPLKLPPLRDRQDDIVLLADYFMRKFAVELARPPLTFSASVIDLLKSYKWPGNIRELQNEIQRLLICATEDIVTPELLSARIRTVEKILNKAKVGPGSLKQQLAAVERYMLIEALREHGNNKTRTAETLGITREGLHKKLSRYGIT